MGKNDTKIKTPDQRIRVFISSTLKELSEERKAARNAIENLRLIPVMFELGARPHPPKELYQAYLEQSHIFIGIYWQSYGWIAENEKISGLEDELLLSENYPRLIYVKEPAPDRDEKLNHMLDFIRSRGNVSYKSFSSAEELARLIADDLAILISERFYSTPEATGEIKKTFHNNLPVKLYPIIGREKEKREISNLILKNETRLITITGPGGIGKTRLAIDIGKSLEQYFDDGIFFADFSGVTNEINICSELARLFEISASASGGMTNQLIEFIANKKILLIIDNFEQLSQAGQVISTLMSKCQNLIVIVTSRNPLELSIETEYSIDSLSVPDKNSDLTDIEMSPAVILFSDRATLANKNFKLDYENIYTVSEICRLLDGIPLAIELAAAKVKIFSLDMIKERLEKKLDLLSGGLKDMPARHKTMKAALEWSYDFLNEDEKKLFRRLSVFNGGFDYDAIENVCCWDIDDPYITIESLLTRKFFKNANEYTSVPRFSMLELIRKYSMELFEQSGESEKIQTNLTDYYLRKVKENSSKYFGAIQVEVPSKWEEDIENVLEAMKIMFRRKQYTALLEMIYSLWPYFFITDHDRKLEKSIDLQFILQNSENLTDEMKGKQNWLEGSAAMEVADFETARTKFDRANYFFTLTKNVRGIAWTNLLLCSLKNNSDKKTGDNEILDGFNTSTRLFRECMDFWGESVAFQYEAAFLMNKSNYLMAIESYDKSLTIVKKMGIDSVVGYIISMKALANIEMKNYDAAFNLLKDASEIFHKFKPDEGFAYCLLVSAYFLFITNSYNNAMLIAGLYKNLFSKFSFAPWHMLSVLFEYLEQKVKNISEIEFTSSFDQGMKTNIYKAPKMLYKVMHEMS